MEKKNMKIIDIVERITPRAVMTVKVGERTFYAHISDNPAAKALVKKLNSEIFSPEMTDRGGIAKVAPLPWDIPSAEHEFTTAPGDIVLLDGNLIALFGGSETGGMSPLANIYGMTGEDYHEFFGEGTVRVDFSLEWSE